MTNWLGVDHGTRRIGLAMGNTDERIACPLGVIPADGDSVAKILEFARDYDAAGIVVGLPLNMDGTEGPQAKAARNFAGQIPTGDGLDVRLWDERLSSFEADQAMAGDITGGRRVSRRDAIAASMFLEDFLTNSGPESASVPGDSE